MKKPKSIIIQGHTYKIISNNSKDCKENLESKDLRGCIKYPEQTIYIAPDQHEQSWELTLWHEIIHGFYNHMGLFENEKRVDNLATSLYTFFHENKIEVFK